MLSWTDKLMLELLLVWACADIVVLHLSPRGAALWLVVALLAVGMACKVAVAGLCIMMCLQRSRAHRHKNHFPSHSIIPSSLLPVMRMTLRAMTISAETIMRNLRQDDYVRLLMNSVLESGLLLVDGLMVGPQLTSDTLLGEGAFGRVYQLDLADVETPICMKVKKDANYSNDDHLFNNDYCFMWEVDNLQRVAGLQGVPQVVAVSVVPEAFIMTRHGCRTLEAWIRIWEKAKPMEKEVAEVLLQLCSILINLHELQVCHNDIKGDNVMVEVEEATKKTKGPRFKVTLVDFAVLCSYGSYPYGKTPRGMFMLHNDPGLMRGERKCSEATDVFSMGYLLRRTLPFFTSPRREEIEECSELAMGACHFRPSFVEIEEVLRHATK